jgi:hypothetical protein
VELHESGRLQVPAAAAACGRWRRWTWADRNPACRRLCRTGGAPGRVCDVQVLPGARRLRVLRQAEALRGGVVGVACGHCRGLLTLDHCPARARLEGPPSLFAPTLLQECLQAAALPAHGSPAGTPWSTIACRLFLQAKGSSWEGDGRSEGGGKCPSGLLRFGGFRHRCRLHMQRPAGNADKIEQIGL